MSSPAGLFQSGESCHACPASFVDVWWTVRDDGRFRRYCIDCWGRLVGVWK